jgi:hypothetical protein
MWLPPRKDDAGEEREFPRGAGVAGGVIVDPCPPPKLPEMRALNLRQRTMRTRPVLVPLLRDPIDIIARKAATTT